VNYLSAETWNRKTRWFVNKGDRYLTLAAANGQLDKICNIADAYDICDTKGSSSKVTAMPMERLATRRNVRPRLRGIRSTTSK
jgi:hypothetical protein